MSEPEPRCPARRLGPSAKVPKYYFRKKGWVGCRTRRLLQDSKIKSYVRPTGSRIMSKTKDQNCLSPPQFCGVRVIHLCSFVLPAAAACACGVWPVCSPFDVLGFLTIFPLSRLQVTVTAGLQLGTT